MKVKNFRPQGDGFRACKEGTPGTSKAERFFHLINQNKEQKAR